MKARAARRRRRRAARRERSRRTRSHDSAQIAIDIAGLHAVALQRRRRRDPSSGRARRRSSTRSSWISAGCCGRSCAWARTRSAIRPKSCSSSASGDMVLDCNGRTDELSLRTARRRIASELRYSHAIQSGRDHACAPHCRFRFTTHARPTTHDCQRSDEATRRQDRTDQRRRQRHRPRHVRSCSRSKARMSSCWIARRPSKTPPRRSAERRQGAGASSGIRPKKRASPQAIDAAVREFGALDVCFANAGVSGGLVPLQEQTPEHWSRDPQDQSHRHVPRGEARGARHDAAQARLDHLHRVRRGIAFGRGRLAVQREQGRRHQPGADDRLSTERQRRAHQCDLPGSDRDRHDAADLRAGARPRHGSQDRSAQSAAPRRRAGSRSRRWRCSSRPTTLRTSTARHSRSTAACRARTRSCRRSCDASCSGSVTRVNRLTARTPHLMRHSRPVDHGTHSCATRCATEAALAQRRSDRAGQTVNRAAERALRADRSAAPCRGIARRWRLQAPAGAGTRACERSTSSSRTRIRPATRRRRDTSTSRQRDECWRRRQDVNAREHVRKFYPCSRPLSGHRRR